MSCACCTSRRQFIGGLATLGASALMPAVAGAQAPYRIDVHHHIFPRPVLDLQEKLNPAWGRLAPPRTLKEWTPAIMIEDMDKNGVAAAIGSPPAPGAWFGDPAAARQIMRAWNEYAAGIVRDHRSRFGFFAMLAPPDVDGSLKEIEHAFDVLKADGIGLHSNYAGKYLGEAAFAPIFDELHRRKATVYIHPTFAPCCSNVQPDIRTNLLEFPFDSTRNIVSLLYSGTLSRHPLHRLARRRRAADDGGPYRPAERGIQGGEGEDPARHPLRARPALQRHRGDDQRSVDQRGARRHAQDEPALRHGFSLSADRRRQ